MVKSLPGNIAILSCQSSHYENNPQEHYQTRNNDAVTFVYANYIAEFAFNMQNYSYSRDLFLENLEDGTPPYTS